MSEPVRKAPSSYKAFRISAGVIVILIAVVGAFAVWDLLPRELLTAIL
ncbi:hypothetical protein ACT3SY_15315 [Brachybacterium sp. AOP42-E1-35]